MDNIRSLVCLAIFSVAVDLARQIATKEQMKREVRRELIQEKFASQGLVHPTTLPLRQRLQVYWSLGPF